MIVHHVDPHDRTVDPDDVATWLLFFLESHGADVTLGSDHSVQVNLDSMSSLTAETAARWAPTIVNLIPCMRTILIARMVETIQ